MRRREFITLLGGASARPSFVALAQVPAKRALIALLLASSKTATQERRSGFRLGMQETHTWVVGNKGKNCARNCAAQRSSAWDFEIEVRASSAD
jgi:hypothetical protein